MYRISCVQTFLKFSQLPHWVSNECGDSDNGAADKMRYTFEYNFPPKGTFFGGGKGVAVTQNKPDRFVCATSSMACNLDINRCLEASDCRCRATSPHQQRHLQPMMLAVKSRKTTFPMHRRTSM